MHAYAGAGLAYGRESNGWEQTLHFFLQVHDRGVGGRDMRIQPRGGSGDGVGGDGHVRGEVVFLAIGGGEVFDAVILTPDLIDTLIKEGKVSGSATNLARAGIGVGVRVAATRPRTRTACRSDRSPAPSSCDW